MTLTTNATKALVNHIEFNNKLNNITDVNICKQYANLITAETMGNVIRFVSDVICSECENGANDDTIATLRDISEELHRTFNSVTDTIISNAYIISFLSPLLFLL